VRECEGEEWEVGRLGGGRGKRKEGGREHGRGKGRGGGVVEVGGWGRELGHKGPGEGEERPPQWSPGEGGGSKKKRKKGAETPTRKGSRGQKVDVREEVGGVKQTWANAKAQRGGRYRPCAGE